MIKKLSIFVIIIITIVIFAIVVEPKNYDRIKECINRLVGYILPCPKNISQAVYDHQEEYQRNFLIEKREIHNIPNNIFQIYIHQDTLPTDIINNINFMKRKNPRWKYYLITDANVDYWFRDMNDPTFKIIYDDISGSYPAAKCDLLRYLLMKHYGGVYLDIKSRSKYPLDDIIEPKIMLFNWCFLHTNIFSVCSVSSKRKRKTDNEMVQWALVYPKGHFFIDAVLERLKLVYNEYKNDKNIDQCIYYFTGPDNYTDTISKLANSENSIIYPSFVDKGFQYNTLPVQHACFSKGKHYLKVKGKIIE
jgi:mannosyltransferase OCH1-like enzyme